MKRLAGRVAIVTRTIPDVGGPGPGAGEERAAVAARYQPGAAKRCAIAIQDEGGRAIALAGDVTDHVHVDEAVRQTVAEWGRINIWSTTQSSSTSRAS